MITEHSTDTKAISLGVEAGLKLSVAGGLISVDGAAKFLTDEASSANQTRITLRYRCTTKFAEVTMNHLTVDNIAYTNIFDQRIATHVVVGILYGAQAFFVFDQNVSENEDHVAAHSKLKLIVKSIPTISDVGVKTKCGYDLTECQKITAETITCEFYGDMRLQSNPTTFYEALEVYQNLPNHIGENGENGVPLSVWLYPLDKLDARASNMTREISFGVYNELQYYCEELNTLERKCTYLLSKPTCLHMQRIGKTIHNFKDYLSIFRQNFQRQLTHILPEVRGCEKDEVELLHIMEKISESPFNIETLGEWMKTRETEINILESYFKGLMHVDLADKSGDVSAKLFEYDSVVYLHVHVPFVPDQFIDTLKHYIFSDQNDKEHQHCQPTADHWYKNLDIKMEMRQKVKTFASFAADNASSDTKFLVKLSTTEHPLKNIAVMRYFVKGMEITSNFVPPGPPSKPTITKLPRHIHRTTKLTWKPPQVGVNFIQHYEIAYRLPNEEKDTGTFTTTDTECMFETRDLSEPCYKFRVRAVCKAGAGPYGDES